MGRSPEKFCVQCVLSLIYSIVELIFVTNITNYIPGEKICRVEKFQLSMYDNCEEVIASKF